MNLSRFVLKTTHVTRTENKTKRPYVLTLRRAEQALVREADRKALTTGLALHRKGRSLMDAGQLPDALDVMVLAEEAFDVADLTKFIIDNVAGGLLITSTRPTLNILLLLCAPV